MRNFRPPLRRADLDVLFVMPHLGQEPLGGARCRATITARELVMAGLLEVGNAPGFYRLTTNGADCVSAWKKAGY